MTFYSARYHTRKTLFSHCTSIISVMEYLSPKMGEFDLQQIYEKWYWLKMIMLEYNANNKKKQSTAESVMMLCEFFWY